MIARQSIDQVINAAHVEEVVGEYVNLKKSGSNLKGNCPFHGEKTPSFMVSPAKGIYKCFGCGKAGNAVSFIMEHDNMDFPQAIRVLAAKYHIELIEDNQNEEEYNEEKQQRESQFIALEAANVLFENNLWEDEEGKTLGLTYFRERSFSTETIKKFRLGYAKNSRVNALTELEKKGFKQEVLLQTGIIKKRDDEKIRDVFAERVTFPFHNLSGKIVGFGGRHFNKDNGPKYLNSPETELYKKSDLLYGIYFAKNAIRKQDKCYLVEGYTDVITLVQSKIENVVASSGTSLTDGQVKQIHRFTKNITIIYDGDNAGIKASIRGIDVVLLQGMNCRIVLLPKDEDPDSFCKQIGGPEFEKYIAENEKDFILHKSAILFEEAKNDPIKKSEAIREIVGTIALVQDALIRNTYTQELSSLYDVPLQILHNEVRKSRSSKQQLPIAEKQIIDKIDHEINEQFEDVFEKIIIGEAQEKAVTQLLIRAAEVPAIHHTVESIHVHLDDEVKNKKIKNVLFEELANENYEFENKFYEKIVFDAAEADQEGKTLDEIFFLTFPDVDTISFIADTLAMNYKISPIWEEKHEIKVAEIESNYFTELKECLLHLKLRKLESILVNITEEISKTEDELTLENLQEKHIKNKLLQMEIAKHFGAANV